MNEDLKELFLTVYEYNNKLIPAFETRAMKLRQGERFKTAEYEVFIEGLVWVINALASAGSEFNIDINEAQKQLDSLITVLENGDYVLTSDILDYELVPLIAGWQDKLISKLQ